MSENVFGTPNYDRPQATTLRYKKRKTLKPGSNRYRVMPPIHSLAASGAWFYWAALEYGYCGVNPKDADKPIPRPSKCILRTTKANGEIKVLQPCPECTLRFQKKQELEALVAQLKLEGKNDAEVKELSEPLSAWLQSHNKDSKVYLNVMSESGEYELLAISGKCKAALDVLFSKIRAKYKIDPIAVDGGVWIDFVRTVPPGKPLAQCTDAPEIVMEVVTTADGEFERPKKAPLTPELLDRAAKECVDLPKMFTEISYAQKKALVECDGEPATVDAILGLTQKNDTPSATPAAVAAPVVAQTASVAKVATPKTTVATPKAAAPTPQVVVTAPSTAEAPTYQDLFGDE